MNTIHATAIIDPKAEIGQDVEIGPYCIIGPYVEIGDRTRLHSHVTLTGPTTIGSDNEFFPYSVIGADPQDLKFHGERALLVIGEKNQIREHVTIHRGTDNGGGVTRVGNENLLMVAAHVAHDCIVGDHCIIANQVMLGGHSVIEDCVGIGGGAGIHHFTTLGTLSFIGGLARVKKDVPPYMKVEGEPVEVRGVNSLALQRRHFSEAEIAGLKEAYKRLFLHRNGNGNSHHGVITRSERNTIAQPMSVVIEQLLIERGHLQTVHRLCHFLLRAGEGVHGRSLEKAREDCKYATQPK